MSKTIYKVTTTTCGTCKMVQPHWEKAKASTPNVEFAEVIVDKSDEYCHEIEICDDGIDVLTFNKLEKLQSKH